MITCRKGETFKTTTTGKKTQEKNTHLLPVSSFHTSTDTEVCLTDDISNDNIRFHSFNSFLRITLQLLLQVK